MPLLRSGDFTESKMEFEIPKQVRDDKGL